MKTNLPHEVGKHEQVHTFVVWAEDSCYNRVTGTVTITTYNDVSMVLDITPPVGTLGYKNTTSLLWHLKQPSLQFFFFCKFIEH